MKWITANGNIRPLSEKKYSIKWNGESLRLETYKTEFYWGNSYLNVFGGSTDCSVFKSIPYSELYSASAGVTMPGVTFATTYELSGPYKIVPGNNNLQLYYGQLSSIMGLSYYIG